VSRFRKWLFGKKRPDTVEALRGRVEKFRDLVEQNNRVLSLMADADEKLGGEYIFDSQYLSWLDSELARAVRAVVQDLSWIAPGRHAALESAFLRIRDEVAATLGEGERPPAGPLCVKLERLGSEDASLAGEKMARLGELRSRLDVPVPSGFVVTAAAFDALIRHADLGALVDAVNSPGTDPIAAGAELQARLETVPLPRNVVRAIKSALRPFHRHARFALRSSAIGEDGQLSFAGMHTTVLNVPRKKVIEAYRRVVASLFAERALLYRRDHGRPGKRVTMAVGCMRLVPAVASGVLYSLDPGDPDSDAMLISATWGFGTTVVEGTGPVDRFLVSRRPPHPILDATVVQKKFQFLPESAEGLRCGPVAASRRTEPSMGSPELSRLATIALAVERHMRCPQDIEWSLDEQGTLWILQARPLRLAPSPRARSGEFAAAMIDHPVLMRGAGAVACRGIAAGRVVVVDPEDSGENIPPGSVLVTRYASPHLAHLLPSAAALIADFGSPASHLAALAREHRLPALMATEAASRILESGREVTVDTEENVVYSGRVEALIRHSLLRGDRYGESREFRTLRGMLKFVTPLHLRNPASRRFTPQRCSSYHDVIRFAHEKAVLALSNQSNIDWRGARRWLRNVAMDIPLGLSLIDLGGGVAAEAPPGDVELSHVTCKPLATLLQALAAPGIWGTRPADIDLTALLSSVTRSTGLTALGAMEVRRNLAIVSGRHMNLNLYLGYHFNIIDCYLGENPEDSYMLFRFVGGISELTRRARRADLLNEILTRHGFAVQRTGDLVIARLHGVSPAIMKRRLQMAGRLIGFTRQLDVLLRSDDITQRLVDGFMAGGVDPVAVLQGDPTSGAGMHREDTLMSRKNGAEDGGPSSVSPGGES